MQNGVTAIHELRERKPKFRFNACDSLTYENPHMRALPGRAGSFTPT